MATFNPRKFTNPDWLGTISPSGLAALLWPWRVYLGSHGFSLPAEGEKLDCAALAVTLMLTDGSVPIEMIDALYYVHETSTVEDAEELHALVRRRGLVLEATIDAAPVDFVVQIWLTNPDIIRDRHAEAVARRQKSFDFYGARRPGALAFPVMNGEVRASIEASLDDWFAEHRRGRGCRLVVFRDDRKVWVLVRHGSSMRRELSHADDGSTATQFYRPQQHDVLIYDERTGELAIHASTKGEKTLYLRTLGRELFGGEEHFQARTFDLSPLVEQGPACLQCEDIPGIEAIRLIECRQFWGGRYKESETRRAADVFASLADRGISTIRGPAPQAATFMVKFADSPKERRVALRAPASAQYERNEDGELIELWLERRGFLTRPAESTTHGDAVPAEVLVGVGDASGLGHRST